MNKVHVDHELLRAAIQATDNYLGVLKASRTEGTEQHIHDFTQHYTNAHSALKALNAVDEHEPYMKGHVGEMIKNAKDEDLTLADEPYAHAPKGAGEADESVKQIGKMMNEGEDTSDYYLTPSGRKVRAGRINLSKKDDKNDKEDDDKMNESLLDESSEAALRNKADKSGVSIGTLRKVFKRGVAAWRTSHRPGTTPTQWGLARVNSYIMKGKTYHTADKDLREENLSFKSFVKEEITEDQLDNMANSLEWHDIVELYNDDEVEFEGNDPEVIDEKISAMSRIQRRMRFARTSTRRDVAKMIKLRRASDVKTLQIRAHKAARRALMNRFLRGRDKSQLSAQEKDQIEGQVNRMAALQANLAVKMLPRVRELEKKRLARR
jgi:hypothetical protein